MKICALVQAAIVCLSLLTGNASAETYRFAVSDYRPYLIVRENDITGVAVETVREAYHRAGIAIEIVNVPFKRALAEVKSGKSHGTIFLFKTRERQAYAHYSSRPLGFEETVLISRRDFQSPFDGSLNSIAGSTVLVPSGFSLGSNMDLAFKNGTLTKMEVPDTANIVRMLQLGRADYFSNEREVLRNQLRNRNQLDQVRFLDPPLNRTPSWVAFTKVGTAGLKLKKIFDREHAKLQLEGFYAAQLNRDW